MGLSYRHEAKRIGHRAFSGKQTSDLISADGAFGLPFGAEVARGSSLGDLAERAFRFDEP
jgi:hypothetical protein